MKRSRVKPTLLEAWVDMAGYGKSGNNTSGAWGLAWRLRETHGTRVIASGTHGNKLERASELEGIANALEYLITIEDVLRQEHNLTPTPIQLTCDEVQALRAANGSIQSKDQHAQRAQDLLAKCVDGSSLRHSDRETTGARLAHQVARLSLSKILPSKAGRHLRTEAELEIPRLQEAMRQLREAGHSHIRRGGLQIVSSSSKSSGIQTVSLLIQKGEQPGQLLWKGRRDKAPPIVETILDELERAERERVRERLNQNSKPTSPSEIKAALLEALNNCGSDGLSLKEANELVGKLGTANLERLINQWSEIDLSQQRIRLHHGKSLKDRPANSSSDND